jgi:hypothetical protein
VLPFPRSPAPSRAIAVVTAGACALALASTACGHGEKLRSTPIPPPPTVTSSPSLTPSSSASPGLVASRSFVSDGVFISGWYWLRDAAREQTALWLFDRVPAGAGALTVSLDVLATDRADGDKGVDARFILAWARSGKGGTPGPWLGSRAVTLANTSAGAESTGYSCTGTISLPRASLGAAGSLVVQISRTDPRSNLPASDVHVAVRQSSVQLQR